VKCAPSDALLRDAMSAWYLFEKKLMLGPESLEAPGTIPGGVFGIGGRGRLLFRTQPHAAAFSP